MLTIHLDPTSHIPIYQQLYSHIKREIIHGKYPYNMKLPSKRQLSAHLQCSQNTVQNAYDQLIAEGYISAKPRSGFYVCKLEGIFTIENEPAFQANIGESEQAYQYDFTHHGVDPESFPFSTWRKLIKDVINPYDQDLLKTSQSQGDFLLRSSIAGYLHQFRGVNCSPKQIVISSGTELLLQLLIQLFSGDCVFALENPGYEKLNLIFNSNRARYRAIPLDAYGMLSEELAKSPAEVACVTPSHQFPTGSIMPISRRIQLLNWANDRPERYIIEDDYDSEFKYGGKPIPSLQSMDAGGKVIYMGAFSKSLTPAIRISYMVLPEQLLKGYNDRLSFSICPVPVIEQKALQRFISEGYFERHLNKMRNIYRKKRELLILAIEKLLPDAEISGANAGLHLLLKIENGMSEKELVSSAQSQGVRVYGFSQFYLGDIPSGYHACMLLGYGALKTQQVYEAVEALKKAWL